MTVTFHVDSFVLVVHSNWQVNSERVRWPRETKLAHYQRVLLHGDELPNDMPIYDFLEACHSNIFHFFNYASQISIKMLLRSREGLLINLFGGQMNKYPWTIFPSETRKERRKGIFPTLMIQVFHSNVVKRQFCGICSLLKKSPPVTSVISYIVHRKDALMCIPAFQSESSKNIERVLTHRFIDARGLGYGRRMTS